MRCRYILRIGGRRRRWPHFSISNIISEFLLLSDSNRKLQEVLDEFMGKQDPTHKLHPDGVSVRLVIGMELEYCNPFSGDTPTYVAINNSASPRSIIGTH